MEGTTKGGTAGKRVPRDAVRAQEGAKMRTEDGEDVGGPMGCAWMTPSGPSLSLCLLNRVPLQ